MALTLSDAERAIADGVHGEGAAGAMRIVIGAGEGLGAQRLIPIASAHIDGCLYHGDGGTEFAEMLADRGAKVSVPTTLNVGGLDLLRPDSVRYPPHERRMALRLMRAHEAMGCRATFTCAPYEAGHRPALGTDVAWGESNAVAFCNSVLGARTNRYGDFLDIASAIVGRAPDCGLHRPEARAATLLFDAWSLPDAVVGSDHFWPVLGALIGREAGEAVVAIDGVGHHASEERLKALGAAAAAWGATALFHIIGFTPEAPTLVKACQGRRPKEVVTLTVERLRATLELMSTATGGTVDAVAVGSPHASLRQVRAVIERFGGRRTILPFYLNTGRHLLSALSSDEQKSLGEIGVTLITDTCIAVAPIVAPTAGVVMTNSGKFASYLPANLNVGVVYGSLVDCVESAVAGRRIRSLTPWD